MQDEQWNNYVIKINLSHPQSNGIVNFNRRGRGGGRRQRTEPPELFCYGNLEQHVNYGQMSSTVQCNSGSGVCTFVCTMFPRGIGLAQQKWICRNIANGGQTNKF